MDLQTCEQTLQNQSDTNPHQIENISQLTNAARAKDKPTCVSQMWGMTQVKNFLINKSEYEIYKKQNPQTTNIVQTHGASTSLTSATISNIISSYIWPVIQWLIIIVFIIILFKIIKKWLILFYDLFNFKRMIYLKVMLPRNDSKSDREQDKEIAKDMKEKIWRMAQVFHNIHKLWELSARDSFMRVIFHKPKTTLILQYEEWMLHFILWIYPEYQKIVESSISAQYADCSIEKMSEPKMFSKKYRDVMPMIPKKNQVYNIKIFKQQPDDPLNNVIDAMWKISRYDTASIIIPIKPIGTRWNKKAQKRAEWLYRNDKTYADWSNIFLRILKALNPFHFVRFLVSGAKSPQAESEGEKYREWWKDFVRMVKAKEDYLNSMWEEAALPFFESGLILATSSDDKSKLEGNIDIIVSAFNIYGDEYGNELIELNKQHDIFWFIYKPLWKLAIIFRLNHFFFKKSIFWVNELSSLFHFPDNSYNRSPIISWMWYKVLPAPENLPVLNNPNWYVMNWVLAESFKNWNLSEILKDYKTHRAVWEKTIKEEILKPIEEFTQAELKWKEIVEKVEWNGIPQSGNGKKFVKITQEKKWYWYKLYKDGILLWVNIYRNTFSPIYIKREDRTRHYYCIWKSGTWKSVFLQTSARQDIWNGDGLCLIDPHGDLAEDILSYIPKERAKDVIYFDAGNEQRPMWLNLYEINTLDEADKVVNDATEIFLKMFWPEIFGPRLQEYFKYGSLTLLEDFEDRPTLLDVVRLFTDEWYREYKLKKVSNPVVKNRWEKTFNAMGQREKEEIIPYFSAKFVSFNTNRIMRNIIWQTKSGFNFDEVMNSNKILIINLSKWRIWELNAELLWMILVSKIYNWAMARAKIPEKDRKDFYLYVDEFQNFISWTFADILSEARKYRLSLIMAHQYIGQLEWWWGNNIWQEKWWKTDVKAAVFGNVGTMQSFKVGAPDAEFLEKEYTPLLSAWDIVWIANFKAYIKLNIDSSTTRPFSLNMIYTHDYQNPKIVPILKEYSAKKYGRKREFVDAEIQARLWITPEDESSPKAPETNTEISNPNINTNKPSETKTETGNPNTNTNSKIV